MINDGHRFNIITGTGRCGTVSLANLLSKSPSTMALHEGQCRSGIEAKQRVLPHLIIQNLAAYLDPQTAEDILRKFRQQQVRDFFNEHYDIRTLVDVAYYYAPFVAAIPRIFPDTKMAVVVRDGRHFVRSIYSAEIPDPMPGGYTDEREYNNLELFAHTGRLRPSEDSHFGRLWQAYTPFQKNCWLWSETNRLIFDGLNSWPPSQVKVMKFETLFSDAKEISGLLEFFEIDDIGVQEIRGHLGRKLNVRLKSAIPHPDQWSESLIKQFDEIASGMMNRLGYS